jgi:hypothetical protein
VYEDLTSLTAQEFSAWLDKQLLVKYALDFDRLLDDVRPSLLLLKTLQLSLIKIAALVRLPSPRTLACLCILL